MADKQNKNVLHYFVEIRFKINFKRALFDSKSNKKKYFLSMAQI